MIMTGTSDLLARVNFPLYSVRMLTNRHVLVAGGGGHAKVGIPNGFEIFELYHDGEHCRSSPLTYFNTDDKPIMNSTSFPEADGWTLFTGQDENCCIYKLKYKILHPDEEGEIIGESKDFATGNIRRRRRTGSRCVEDLDVEEEELKKREKLKEKRNGTTKKISFDIQPVMSVQTDFSKEEAPLQRVVRCSWDHSVLVTGGVDGVIRFWKYPEFEKIGSINAHTKEIDDLDMSPSGKQVVSISKDGKCFIWNTKDRNKKSSLEWKPPPDCKYLFKRCRYGMIEGKRDRSRLFTIHNPIGSTKQPSYINQWETNSYQLSHSLAKEDILSALAVSEDGNFISVGSMFDGSVYIYISYNLQLLHAIKEAHRSFVTGLEFIPCSEEAARVTGYHETSVISISVDNQIQIHNIPKRVMIPTWGLLLLSVIVLVMTFLLASWLGL